MPIVCADVPLRSYSVSQSVSHCVRLLGHSASTTTTAWTQHHRRQPGPTHEVVWCRRPRRTQDQPQRAYRTHQAITVSWLQLWTIRTVRAV